MKKITKFTIVIPTRERCDTLESSLRTCVTQDYDNLEIIVSDNFSQDSTKEVVLSFNDNRIRYVNTGRRMSMSDNWEFGLSHVRDGYVMILGDDNGLLPQVLVELASIINDTGCDAITWERASYIWPRCDQNEQTNILKVPLLSSLVRVDLEKMMTNIVNFKHGYAFPNLYHSFVSYEAIKKVTKESGRFFQSLNTDIYSGIALACVVNSCYFSSRPYAIDGISHHSSGAGFFARQPEKRLEYEKVLSEGIIPFHSKLICIPSNTILLFEAILQAQHYLSAARRFKVDIKKLLINVAREAVLYPTDHYEEIIEGVKEMVHRNQLEYCLDEIIQEPDIISRRRKSQEIKPVLGYNIKSHSMVVDGRDFDVRNIYEASLLCNHIMALNKLGYFSACGVMKTTHELLRRRLAFS